MIQKTEPIGNEVVKTHHLHGKWSLFGPKQGPKKNSHNTIFEKKKFSIIFILYHFHIYLEMINNGEDWKRIVLTEMDWEREEREKVENLSKVEEGGREKRR